MLFIFNVLTSILNAMAAGCAIAAVILVASLVIVKRPATRRSRLHWFLRATAATFICAAAAVPNPIFVSIVK